MSWVYSDYRFRYPISVDLTGWAAGAVYVQISIPAGWDVFYDNVQADGDDIRIVDSSGTVVQHKILSGTVAGKNLVLQTNNTWTPTATSSQAQLILYWGYASATYSPPTFTAVAPYTGRIEVLAPSRVFTIGREQPGALRPRAYLDFRDEEKRMVVLDFAPLIRGNNSRSGGHWFGDEINYAQTDLKDTTDASVASGCPFASVRFVGGRRGACTQVAVLLDAVTAAITDGSDYVIECKIVMASGEIFNGRVGAQCRDVRPR